MKVWIVISSSYDSQGAASTKVKHVCLSFEKAKQRLKEVSSFLSNSGNVKTSETEISCIRGAWYYRNSWYYRNYIVESDVEEDDKPEKCDPANLVQTLDEAYRISKGSKLKFG